MCWGLRNSQEVKSIRHRKPKPESSLMRFHKSYRERDEILAAKGGPRECRSGECCERVQSCSCRANQCRGGLPSTWQRQTHPSTGPGIHARRGGAGGHGDRRALPLQARLCTQKGRALLLSPGLQGCDRQFFNASLHSQHGPCNGGQQVHIPARHLGVVCYAGKLLELCTLTSSPGRSETTKTSCLIPQVGASGGGIREGFGARGGKGPPGWCLLQAPAWSTRGLWGRYRS